MGNKNNFKHGLKKHRLYVKWSHMKARCYNKNCKDYPDYGGRGIVLCDEWRDNFLSFYNWAINAGWKDGLVIERKWVNGNYEPNNCTFTPAIECAKNTTRTRLITYNGKTQSLADWSRETGLNHKLISYRINQGWPIELCLTNQRFMYDKHTKQTRPTRANISLSKRKA